MRTIIVWSLIAGFGIFAGVQHPAQAQGSFRIFVPNIACLIDFEDIGIAGEVGRDNDLILDGTAESASVSLVGTPPNEKIQLVCEGRLQNPPPRNMTLRGFECQIFRGRRGGANEFDITTDTSLQIKKNGRTTMRCTIG